MGACGGRCWSRAWSVRASRRRRPWRWNGFAPAAELAYLQPALAWLEGWLTEQQGYPEQALRSIKRGEDAAGTDSPVYLARLCWPTAGFCAGPARGDAVERLRRAHDLYLSLGATPFAARAEEELAACGLPAARQKPSVLAMTSREAEVAHLVGNG